MAIRIRGAPKNVGEANWLNKFKVMVMLMGWNEFCYCLKMGRLNVEILLV